MVALEQLKTEIEAIGEKIKTLKGSNGSKDEITAAVQELLAKKQLYADNNHGIGVDGKPFSASMSKADKKKQAKQQAKDDQPKEQAVSIYYISLGGLYSLKYTNWCPLIHNTVPMLRTPPMRPRRKPKRKPKNQLRPPTRILEVRRLDNPKADKPPTKELRDRPKEFPPPLQPSPRQTLTSSLCN